MAMVTPRKPDQPFESHWHFALTAALIQLQTLVREFETLNAQIDATGHMFAGVPEPLQLIWIIDGFLAEDGWFLQDDIRYLRHMRQELEEDIQPVFESGRNNTRQYWESIPHAQQAELTTWKIEECRAEAKIQAPADATPRQKAWFVEGFCKTWRDQELTYIAKSIGKEWPPPRDKDPKV